MFHLLPKNLFFLPSRSSFSSSQVRRLLTPLSRFQIREFSSSPSPKHRHWKYIEEDEYNLRVSVVWDFETCGVPSGVSYSKVAPSITGALRTEGFKGPIHIEAYGDVYQLSEINQKILFSTGIDLHHIPGGKTNSNGFLVDWISQKPSRRAHLMLISGDRDGDFAFTLSRLNNYIIMVACPGRADHYIRHAATIVWQWSKLLEGKFLENHEHLHDDF